VYVYTEHCVSFYMYLVTGHIPDSSGHVFNGCHWLYIDAYSKMEKQRQVLIFCLCI
jgi:hypothetical protein